MTPSRRPYLPRAAAMLIAGMAIVAVTAGTPLRAQQQNADTRLRAQQDSLDKIRLERADLERRMRDLQGQAHDLDEEVINITRQATSTAAVVRALDNQLSAITREVKTAGESLSRTEDELTDKEVVLQQRLTDIYKRGPLHDLEVLLSAQSFTDLIARYKWLYLVAQRDRALVGRVRDLRTNIVQQRELQLRLQDQIQTNLVEKEAERKRLQALEAQRTQSLKRVQQDAAGAQSRLSAITKDEARINQVIAALDAERRRAGTAAAASGGVGALRVGADLPWPVEGTILYPFGQAVGINNTQTKWNGIGIKAPQGTPVRAIGAGKVVLVDPQFSGYGPTVMIQHAGADYSVYSSLARIDVVVGAVVSRGQVIGTVGTSDPRLGPHLHFEIRPGSADGTATLVDPLRYLRPVK